MASSSRYRAPRFAFRLPHGTWKIVGIAFGIGVLCFVLVWREARKDDPLAAPQTPAQAAAQPANPLDPLPAPLAAGDDGASDMPDAKPAPEPTGDEAPKLVETAPAAPPTAPAETTPAAPAAGSTPAMAEDRPLPIQGQMPPPRYPAAALRRGESGSVVVRVDVDANGTLVDASLVQRSGSRDLDRAAMDAVRDWHFRPAQRDGHPVAGSIDIPFDFNPGQ